MKAYLHELAWIREGIELAQADFAKGKMMLDPPVNWLAQYAYIRTHRNLHERKEGDHGPQE